jgi:hypothetical protein
MKIADFVFEDAASHKAREYSATLNQHFSPAGLPVKITKHFVERMVDPRNQTPITAQEVANFFAQLFRQQLDYLVQLPPESSLQVSQSSSGITVPIIRTENGIVATTVMRGRMRRGGEDLLTI